MEPYSDDDATDLTTRFSIKQSTQPKFENRGNTSKYPKSTANQEGYFRKSKSKPRRCNKQYNAQMVCEDDFRKSVESV